MTTPSTCGGGGAPATARSPSARSTCARAGPGTSPSAPAPRARRCPSPVTTARSSDRATSCTPSASTTSSRPTRSPTRRTPRARDAPTCARSSPTTPRDRADGRRVGHGGRPAELLRRRRRRPRRALLPLAPSIAEGRGPSPVEAPGPSMVEVRRPLGPEPRDHRREGDRSRHGVAPSPVERDTAWSGADGEDRHAVRQRRGLETDLIYHHGWTCRTSRPTCCCATRTAATCSGSTTRATRRSRSATASGCSSRRRPGGRAATGATSSATTPRPSPPPTPTRSPCCARSASSGPTASRPCGSWGRSARGRRLPAGARVDPDEAAEYHRPQVAARTGGRRPRRGAHPHRRRRGRRRGARGARRRDARVGGLDRRGRRAPARWDEPAGGGRGHRHPGRSGRVHGQLRPPAARRRRAERAVGPRAWAQGQRLRAQPRGARRDDEPRPRRPGRARRGPRRARALAAGARGRRGAAAPTRPTSARSGRADGAPLRR